MAVGTNIGRTYDGQQGTGFATILDYNPSADIAVANQKASEKAAQEKAKADAQAKRIAAHREMMKAKPDWWHRHDQEVDALWQGAQDFGAAAIAEGLDPFTDSSENSVKFRQLLDKTELYAKASEEKRSSWEKFKEQVYTNPEKAKKLKNIDEITEYFNNPSIIGEVEGGGKMPVPEWAEPLLDTQKAIMNAINLKAGDNKDYVPSMNDAYDIAGMLQTNPAYSEGFGSANSVMAQGFNRIKNNKDHPEIYEGYVARAAKKGVDPYTQYLAETTYNAKTSSETTDDIAESIKVGSKESEVEQGDVTIGSKRPAMSDKDIEKAVRLKLSNKIGTVQREVDAGIYGDPDWTLDKNMEAAVKHTAKLVKQKQDTKYTRKEDEAGKSKKEAEKSRDEWYDAITGKLGEDAQRRAEGQLEGMEIDGMKVTQVFPMEGGVRVNIGDETGQKEQVDIPIQGVPKEDVLSRYDKSLKAGRKPFDLGEKEAIPGISENKIKISGF